jgi:hypothetical protein
VLAAGDKVGAASVWTAPNDRVTIEELLSDGPMLFLFYLFDWSAT